MNFTGKHLIDGCWQPSSKNFTANNPMTGETLSPPFFEATQEQVDAALTAAQKAFEQTYDFDPRWPADLLDAIASRITDLGDALLDRAEAETALPKARLTGERARTVGQLKMFAQLVRDGSWLDATIDTADPNRQPLPKPDIRRMLRPRGPVVVFGASNFPFAFSTTGGDTASALAAGNPVIVKGHPSHPGTSEMFAAAVLAAIESLNLPRGLFALLQGRSNEVGGALVKHPLTAAVGFTGSQKGGRALFDLAAARAKPIPVFAEMGSLNPLVLMPDALHLRGETIAKDLAGSVLMGCGQFCTKPGLILTLGDSKTFVESLAKNIAATPSVTMLNQGLRDAFLARVNDWTKFPRVITHGHSTNKGYASVSPSLFETTADVFVREPKLHEEAFGPAALVVHCDNIQQLAAALQTVGGSLTGTIHTGPADDPAPLLRLLEPIVGRIILNGYPTGVEVCSAMVHGGPYPATTDPGTTSVGSAAIRRFVRLIAYQNTPDNLLPPALRNENPLGIVRRVDGVVTKDKINEPQMGHR